MEDRPEGKFFVTARGWEDLSEILKGYEALGVPVTEALVGQYLQKAEVAREFSACYALYRKYETDYGIPEILAGGDWADKAELVKNGGFEERFIVVTLLADALGPWFSRYSTDRGRILALHEKLLQLKRSWGEGPEALAGQMEKSLAVRREAGLVEEDRAEIEQWVADRLRAYGLELKKDHIYREEPGFEKLRQLFAPEAEAFGTLTAQAGQALSRGFRFAETCFGEGQEMVLLVTDLTRNPQAMEFIQENGSEDFLRHSDVLLYRQQEQTLMEQCRELLAMQ